VLQKHQLPETELDPVYHQPLVAYDEKQK